MSFEEKYNASENEQKIREFWQENKIYEFDETTSKPTFSIDTPPPTLSGRMHIGHAFSYTQTDFVARYKRMTGFEVFYPFGTDDNGLATEKLVQKEKKVNLRIQTRDEAFAITNEYLTENRPQFVQDWKNLGISADFENLNYSTIDDRSRKISQQSFLDLYKKGLIQQREGPVAWDRVFQTAIAQAELEDLERKAYLLYVKAKIKSTENTYLIYATTRPELCFGVGGVSVEDHGEYVKLQVGHEYWITGAATYLEKFSDIEYQVVEKLTGEDLIGEIIQIPYVNRDVKVSHDVAVKADFGTGIAYFCSYGGPEDIEWFTRHQKTPFEVLAKDGRLTSLGGKYEGEVAPDARSKITKDLETDGFVIKKEQKIQNVNVGERSGAEVEYIVSKQWYVNYIDKKEYFWEMAQKFNWSPEFMKTRLENWIKGLNWDWGFSRQRKFGIPIPVWYDKQGNKYFPEESQLPVDPLKDRPLSAPKELELIPETDVLDTWFTSASTTTLAMSNVKSDEMKEKLFPFDLRPQAHDIINFWLFYSMAKSNLLFECNPFKNVAISGWVLDPKGKKMSKSKGNTIAPQEVVEKFSNDALRFAAASTKLGQDIPYQEKEVKTGSKLVNKIFNANKFANQLLENFTNEDRGFKLEELNSIDRWVVSKLNFTIQKATKEMEEYGYSFAKSTFEQFFMSDVADNYIEIVKLRLWKPEEFGTKNQKKAQKALYNVLYNSLKGLAPFIPFITEYVYQNFYKKFELTNSIHQTHWPKSNVEFMVQSNVDNGNLFVQVVKDIRKFKAEKQISMKEELQSITILCSNETKEFIENSIQDLKNVISVKEILFEINEEFSVKIIQ
jgi:valyl-tRNA synthetase